MATGVKIKKRINRRRFSNLNEVSVGGKRISLNILREELKKVQKSSASFGGGKKRLDLGAETGDDVPDEVVEEEIGIETSSTEAGEHFNLNKDSDGQ